MKRNGILFLVLNILGAASIDTVYSETFRFQADTMIGSKATGKETVVLQGNAQVWSENLFITADFIEISGKDNQYISCRGSVIGTDEGKGIRFTTSELKYDRTKKIARLEGDSTLEDKKNNIVAKGRFIEYDDVAGTVVIQISVRLFKDNLVCRSDYALYRRNEKLLELSGSPVVYKDGDEFRSDRMRVDLNTEDIVMEGRVQGTLKSAENKKGTDGKP
ncbi:MAG: LptA/OstA family protein [Termitinemataceae bacterium]